MTSTRWPTTRSMPRSSGLSAWLEARPIRPSLSERSVSRCLGLVPLAERTCLITTLRHRNQPPPEARLRLRLRLGRLRRRQVASGSRLRRSLRRRSPSAVWPRPRRLASAFGRLPRQLRPPVAGLDLAPFFSMPRTWLTLRPRSLATCSGRRRLVSPCIVALTRLIGFWVPMLFVSTSRIPASSSTARTPPPAITPVPGLAGRRTTWPAPNRPMIRCGIVWPYIGTRIEALAGVLDRLLDRERHLARLAVADPDHGALVADRDQGGEREAPAALDHLGHAVDLDHPLLEVEPLRADCLDVVIHARSVTLAAQNVSPPSRAPSARALTRPWYW